MNLLSNGLLSDIYLIKPVQRSGQPSWQYPLDGKSPSSYSYKTAQSLLELSYRVSVHNREVVDGSNDPIKLDPPNFDVIIPLNTTFLLQTFNVLWFFYSSSLNLVVVVATSTYDNTLFLVDFDYSQLDPITINNYISGMKLHRGFWNFYSSIRTELLLLLNRYVNDETQVLLTGISLGGAISTIGAIDLYHRKLDSNVVINDVIHYSFASPRAFNIIGAKKYNDIGISSYRINNISDIIPTTPLPIMYGSIMSFSMLITAYEKSGQLQGEFYDFMHVGMMSYFDRHLGNYYANHILAYLNEYNVNPFQ